jgi:hypothetical protein
MPTSNEYRQSAEECYRLAGEAKTETDRLACLELARVVTTWGHRIYGAAASREPRL